MREFPVWAEAPEGSGLAREIARKAGVEFEVMDVSLIGKLGRNSLTDTGMAMDEEKPADSFPNTFVPGRNLFFLSIAAVYAREKGINHIVTGVSQTDFSGYPIAGILHQIVERNAQPCHGRAVCLSHALMWIDKPRLGIGG